MPKKNPTLYARNDTCAASRWSGLCRFLNKYMLIIIALFLGLYLYVYPDVLDKIWNSLRDYSGDSASKITFESLFQAVLFFLFAAYLIRKLKSFLDRRVLSHVVMDIGSRHAVISLIGYIGWLFIGVMTLSIVGINLRNLAIVFGALSVGIGFGLQNVVNNFVSGLVILFERPIKEGDWVVINGQEGIVKNIRIRSTELETFDRANVLIPNADILSSNVLNWTHNDMYGRVVVAVGVSYNSDLNHVRDVLLRCASREKGLLTNPEPYVWITSFGANSIHFELRGITDNVMNKGSIQSRLMFSVFEAFESEGIEIPLPQRIVCVKQGADDEKHD